VAPLALPPCSRANVYLQIVGRSSVQRDPINVDLVFCMETDCRQIYGLPPQECREVAGLAVSSCPRDGVDVHVDICGGVLGRARRNPDAAHPWAVIGGDSTADCKLTYVTRVRVWVRFLPSIERCQQKANIQLPRLNMNLIQLKEQTATDLVSIPSRSRRRRRVDSSFHPSQNRQRQEPEAVGLVCSHAGC